MVALFTLRTYLSGAKSYVATSADKRPNEPESNPHGNARCMLSSEWEYARVLLTSYGDTSGAPVFYPLVHR